MRKTCGTTNKNQKHTSHCFVFVICNLYTQLHLNCTQALTMKQFYFGHQCCLALVVIMFMLNRCQAKLVNGKFQFTSRKTDHVITSYSIIQGGSGLGTMILLAKDEVPEHDELTMNIYLDDDWSKIRKMKSCNERIQYARKSYDITFERESQEQANFFGYKRPQYRAEVQFTFENPEQDRQGIPRHHYWYVTVDNCALENNHKAASKVPSMEYHIQIYNKLSENRLTHLSTDEFIFSRLHTLTFCLSGMVCAALFFKIIYHLRQTGVVHIAKFMVLGAATFDTASSFFALAHMYIYRMDGVGLYTFDAFSSYSEAMCDAIVCFLLLAISAGWTLPTDVITINQHDDNATLIQKVLFGLANPAGSSSWKNPFTGCFFGLITTHAILAKWGLSYNDDYESYHDLEHTPGKILMLIRSLLGLLMIAAVIQTRMKCTASLRKFYATFALIGTLWFQALPVVTWLCNSYVSYHRRQPYVMCASALLQSTSLLLLSWIVAIHASSSYHKVSHITQSSENNLTEKLSGNACGALTWSIFGKAKIRLD